MTGGLATSGAESRQAADPTPQPTLLGLLMVLTMTTGVIDAVSFVGLGHVFTANMTGNVVFLGFALAGVEDLSVERSLLALVAFAAGAIVGGRLTNRSTRPPAQQLPMATAAEAMPWQARPSWDSATRSRPPGRSHMD